MTYRTYVPCESPLKIHPGRAFEMKRFLGVDGVTPGEICDRFPVFLVCYVIEIERSSQFLRR